MVRVTRHFVVSVDCEDEHLDATQIAIAVGGIEGAGHVEVEEVENEG